MTCRYCRATNDEDDHRCHRCGRRLEAGSLHLVTGVPAWSAAATARVLEPEEAPRNEAMAPPSPQPEPEQSSRPAWQPSLFGREMPRLVRLESIAPRAASDRMPARQSGGHAATRPRNRKVAPSQERFDFSAQGARSPRSSDCEQPVAIPAHRLIAAAFDAAIIILAIAIFGATFIAIGGTIEFSRQSTPIFLAAVLLITMFYKVLWCLGNADTAGMRWAHLRTVNFDGRRPTRGQRFSRIAFGCLSLAAAGLGLIWALADEEALTWHDQISRTFPTPF